MTTNEKMLLYYFLHGNITKVSNLYVLQHIEMLYKCQLYTNTVNFIENLECVTGKSADLF